MTLIKTRTERHNAYISDEVGNIKDWYRGRFGVDGPTGFLGQPTSQFAWDEIDHGVIKGFRLILSKDKAFSWTQ